jgi:hypothetical protein
MLSQMRLHLMLGLDHEAKADRVAGKRSDRANGIASGIPQGIEQAGAAVQLLQPFGTPGQMIGFLGGRMQQVLAVIGIARQRRLAKVERLRADLTGVVDAHQSGGMSALGVIEIGFGDAGRRRGPLCGGRAGDSLQCAIASNQQAIKRRQGTGIHEGSMVCGGGSASMVELLGQ